MTLEGSPRSKDAWRGIARRIRNKDRQVAGAGRAWLRLEDTTGLWQFTSLSTLPLPEKLLTLHGGSSPMGSQASSLMPCLFQDCCLAPDGGAPA